MMKLKRTIAALVALAIIAACAASLALTGDVDGDGAIGVKDAVLLCRAIADGGAGANDMLCMDVDADGRLTVADLAYICRAIMDNSVVFPRDAQNAAYSKDFK